MKKNKSFKRELILSFLIIGITSIIILGSFQIYQLYSLVNEKQSNQIALTTFMEDYIDNYVDTHARIIETMSYQISDDVSEGDFASIQQDLSEIKAHYPGFVNLYIGDPEGQAMLFYPEVLTDGVIEENYNFSDRRYYQELIDKQTSVISPAFHGRGGTDLLLVAIVSPIFDDQGNMQGYLLGALDLNELDSYTSNRINDDTSKTIVLDRENNAIVHPNIDTARDLVNLSNNEIVNHIEGNQTSGSFTIQDGDERKFITYGKIESLGWTVWISSPVIAIIGEFLDSIFAVILVALLTGAIVIITSLLLTNRLESAIHKLLHYIHSYTASYKKNEPFQLAAQISGPSEMNEVLIHFNGMMEEIDYNREKLMKLNTELEERVRERTINLENKNTELRFKHAELSAVLESMFEGIMLLDNKKQIRYVNEFFLKVIENEALPPLQTLKDVSERLLTSFDVTQEELDSFFNEGGELKLKNKLESGKVQFYLLHRFSVTSEEEQIGFGLLIQDITKEVEIDTLKDNLISLTSHEFKTPITTIKGSVETLLRNDVDWEPEFKQELLEGVLEDIERIQQLVNDWMDISKIESGTMYIEPRQIHADKVIQESIDRIPPVLQEDATFQFHNEVEGKAVFYADKERVQQVLLNLFTNALRYNDAVHKEVEIILRKNEEYIIISVSDNGIGIDEKHIERIFNRFYQVDVTATRRSGGTGLGLAIVQGVMEAHQGKINVESSVGTGSTFTLYFPHVGKEVNK